jgi:hypothetical protein
MAVFTHPLNPQVRGPPIPSQQHNTQCLLKPRVHLEFPMYSITNAPQTIQVPISHPLLEHPSHRNITAQQQVLHYKVADVVVVAPQEKLDTLNKYGC